MYYDDLDEVGGLRRKSLGNYGEEARWVFQDGFEGGKQRGGYCRNKERLEIIHREGEWKCVLVMVYEDNNQ